MFTRLHNFTTLVLIFCLSYLHTGHTKTIIEPTTASTTSWKTLEQQAQGQTLYFNAWGGNENANDYLQWAAKEAKKRYGINVVLVKIANIDEAIARIQAEKKAGKTEQGSVDLLWVNGESFHTLKQSGLLYGPWVEHLPNWQYVDKSKPVTVDFSEPTEGFEAPWGLAQLTFITDQQYTTTPPTSAAKLLTFARQHPGRVTYPQPPDFHCVALLKQLLIALTPTPTLLQQPVSEQVFRQATAPLWHYLDQLHPFLWRQGHSFPLNAATMNTMLADGELVLSLSFNPNEAASFVQQNRLPPSTYSFGFSAGMIGNVHYLAIPFNSSAKAAAQVFTNFLLSASAQQRKADITIWGDPSVLSSTHSTLAIPQNPTLSASGHPLKISETPILIEPHVSWITPLEQEWLRRYGR
ncbi:MAG: ABC transporter substrate-binding protein [Plesiomonas sp.]|uniref:ABC transporter substrate-binding protein n=1 Tax=Plesiomonas sp. TaxID=2486279 RepID=UPI003F3ABB45